MQVMEKKGLLSHTSQGNAHVYRAAVAREAVLPGLVGRMVSLVFGGRRAAAVQALLGEEKLSAEELAEIRQLLEAHEKKTRKGRKEER
jgi:predicted transcriptional regulator